MVLQQLVLCLCTCALLNLHFIPLYCDSQYYEFLELINTTTQYFERTSEGDIYVMAIATLWDVCDSAPPQLVFRSSVFAVSVHSYQVCDGRGQYRGGCWGVQSQLAQ